MAGAVFSHRCHLPAPCPGPPPTSQLTGRGAGVRGKLWNKKKAGRGGGRLPKGWGCLWWEVTVAPRTIWACTYLRDALHILQAAFFMSSSCRQTVGVPRFTSLWADGGRDLPRSHLFHAAPGVARALLLVPRRPLPHPINWLPLLPVSRLRVACRCIRGNLQRGVPPPTSGR